MSDPSIVVCSFYTDDEYYTSAAASLARDLQRIGVRHVIERLDRAPGEQWPDVCRKKIAFIARVCRDFPDARVFWSDVDCSIKDLPAIVTNFSGDFIAFQRGFDSPLAIGYHSRTRFWEPSFFGIGPTENGRALIEEAARLERTLTIRATDDYFLEEAWRLLAARLSFQVIPSRLADRGGDDQDDAFFRFGASGNVAEFKGKVVQHMPVAGSRRSFRRALRARARRFAKWVEGVLPNGASRRLRTAADRYGITHRLVTKDVAATPQRQALVTTAVRAAKAGDVDGLATAETTLDQTGVWTPAERAALRAAGSFLHYAQGKDSSEPPLALAWWALPYPGNFGDWLSPLVVAAHTNRPLRFQEPSGYAPAEHLVAVGSIGRFIKPNSVVVGTGISRPETDLARNARYVSLRGPLTAAVLEAQGGPSVDSFGDPGLLLSRIIPVQRGTTNGRIAVVRHTNHRKAPLRLPEDADELSVLMSHPDDIADFVARLAEYDAVVTSAMHVMIACHSYGIPCGLVTFEGVADAVPGSGMKYEDYSRGAALESVHTPLLVPTNLTGVQLRDVVTDVQVRADKLDEIEQAMSEAIGAYARN